MRLEYPEYRTDVQVFTGINASPIDPDDPQYDPDYPNDPQRYWYWDKPPGAQFIQATCIAGGGGGGGGYRGAAGMLRRGGWGGSGGGWNIITIPAVLLPDRVPLLVGPAGLSGPGATTDTTMGENGGNGGDTFFGFGTGIVYCAAGGGAGGFGGDGNTPVEGAATAVGAGLYPPGAGAAVESAGGASGCPGGGAGQYIGGVTEQGDTYGTVDVAGVRGRSVGSMAAPGDNSSFDSPLYGPGKSGGGGVVEGGAGQSGGRYGAGGGGGGGSTNGTNGGVGGAGGEGIVLVITYF